MSPQHEWNVVLGLALHRSSLSNQYFCDVYHRVRPGGYMILRNMSYTFAWKGVYLHFTIDLLVMLHSNHVHSICMVSVPLVLALNEKAIVYMCQRIKECTYRDASILCQFPSWMVWWGYSTLPTPEPTSQRKFTFPLRISKARKSTWFTEKTHSFLYVVCIQCSLNVIFWTILLLACQKNPIN